MVIFRFFRISIPAKNIQKSRSSAIRGRTLWQLDYNPFIKESAEITLRSH